MKFLKPADTSQSRATTTWRTKKGRVQEQSREKR